MPAIANRRRQSSRGSFLPTRRFPTWESYAIWLFEFLRVDFANITSGQELDWQEGAKEFVHLGGAALIEYVRGGGLETPEELPTVAFLQIQQQELQAGLEKWWGGLQGWQRPKITSGYVRRGDDITDDDRQGTFRELFLDAMQNVARRQWLRVRKCPHCRRLFLKSRKQAYCSAICGRKERWARFIAHRAPRDYQRERELALKRKLGATSKVHLGRRQSKKRT